MIIISALPAAKLSLVYPFQLWYCMYALDDPFIRITAETRETLLLNSSIEYVESPWGGHCGFLATPSGEPDTCEYRDLHWAEATQ